jgi:hypothetical protein
MKLLYAVVFSAVSAAPLSKTVGEGEYDHYGEYNHNCNNIDLYRSDTGYCPYPFPFRSQHEYDDWLAERRAENDASQ